MAVFFPVLTYLIHVGIHSPGEPLLLMRLCYDSKSIKQAAFCLTQFPPHHMANEHRSFLTCPTSQHVLFSSLKIVDLHQCSLCLFPRDWLPQSSFLPAVFPSTHVQDMIVEPNRDHSTKVGARCAFLSLPHISDETRSFLHRLTRNTERRHVVHSSWWFFAREHLLT